MDQPLPTIPAPGPDRRPGSSDWSRVQPPAAATSSFTVGYVIGRSFRAWGRNALLFCLLGALASVPMALVSYRMYSEMGLLPAPAAAANPFASNPIFVYWRQFLLGYLVTLVAWSLANAAVVHASAQALQGKRVRAGEALIAAVHRAPYVLAVVFLAWLAMVGTACTLVLPIILMIAWCAAIPSTVLEGTGPIRALARSWELTRGHRWTILAGFLVLMLCVWFAAVVVEAVTVAALFAVKGRNALGPGTALGASMAIYQVVAGMLGTVSIVACAVAHHGLRAAKEGGDPAVLAQVFE